MTTFTRIGRHLERNAEMQRERAVEFRTDPRYLKAAQILDGLSALFAAGYVDPELWSRYEALGDTEQEEDTIIGSVGFDAWPNKPDEFLQLIIELVQENRV
jgi:hypothetical protein